MPKGSSNDELNNIENSYSESNQIQGKQYGRRGLYAKVSVTFKIIKLFAGIIFNTFFSNFAK